MVEQNPIARIHPVRLAIVHNNPVRIQLGASVRGSRIEWRGLALGRFHYLSVQFRGGSLVELDVFFESTGTDSVEETKSAQAVNVTRVFCHFEGDFYMGLGTQIVDFRRLHLGDDVDQVGAIGKVTIMKLEFCRAWRDFSDQITE
jgi:hypothetical protein